MGPQNLITQGPTTSNNDFPEASGLYWLKAILLGRIFRTSPRRSTFLLFLNNTIFGQRNRLFQLKGSQARLLLERWKVLDGLELPRAVIDEAVLRLGLHGLQILPQSNFILENSVRHYSRYPRGIDGMNLC